MKYLTLLLLFACSNKPGLPLDLRPVQGTTLLQEGFEMTPIDFLGQNLLLVFEREPRTTDIRQRKVVFYNRYTMEKVKEFNYDLAFSCALVHEGKLYIFGVTKDALQIKYYSTEDLENFVAGGVLLEVPAGNRLYNTSVIHDGTRWVMAYEDIKPLAFSSHVAVADSLEDGFEPIGSPLRPEQYTACPLIRKEGDYYYVLYLSHEYGTQYWNNFALATRVSRSLDLVTWERGPIVFQPMGGDHINFSDVDLITDEDGNFEVYYMNGDQTTWMNIKTLIYEGNFEDMWLDN